MSVLRENSFSGFNLSWLLKHNLIALVMSVLTFICPIVLVAAPFDLDDDGVPDSIDIDRDNDGILDITECEAELDEYFLVPGYHANVVNGPSGLFVTGQRASSNGQTNLNIFTALLPPAYPYTGEAVRAVTGDSSDPQFVLHTTTGLYVWGLQGEVVNASLTSGNAFESLALPTGMAATDIAGIDVGAGVLAIMTDTGEMWVMGSDEQNINGVIYGDASAVNDSAWHQVELVGGAPLTGVVDFEITHEAAFAVTAAGNWYTWGDQSSLGDGSAVSARPQAVPMTKPAAFTLSEQLVQIEMTAGSGHAASYFVLHSNGRIYSMGGNGVGQLGDGTNLSQTTWQTVQKTGGGDLTDIIYVSGNSRNAAFPSAGAITQDPSIGSGTNQMWLWGDGSGNKGSASNPTNINVATEPVFNFAAYVDANGDSVVDNQDVNPLRLGSGGHMTMYWDIAQGRYGYVGHNADGNFGDPAIATGHSDQFQISGTSVLALPDFDNDGDVVDNCLDLDSDNDGISDLFEGGASAAQIAADTNMDGTISLSEAAAANGGIADVDGDGLMDIFDADIGNVSAVASVGTQLVDSEATPDGIPDIFDLDSDGDYIPDTVEAQPTAGYIANDGNVIDDDVDGDGVIALFDANDASSGQFGGTFNAAEDTDSDGTPDYLDLDSDDDTEYDSLEISTVYGPVNSDPDGSVTTTFASLLNSDSDATEVDFRSLNDADGDGVPDISDPDIADECNPNVSGIPAAKDCDGDGNPASGDPDPASPNATDDSGAAGTAIDILDNDDFLPNNDPLNLGTTSITPVATGTTCTGTAAYDALAGSVTYTPAASEISGSCDLVYQVCSTDGSSPLVCETALVTISLSDADGDGVTDALDSAPTDACIPDTAGVPVTKDCDGDGNPVSTDPDSAAPNASDDSGTPGVVINILGNDDFLPNNNPSNLGTTSITTVPSGTTCTGTAAYDALTGFVTYTPAASETSASCDIVYEVCNTNGSSLPVCETAIVTVALSDTDGDGVPDTLDSAPADECVPDMGGTPASKDCDGDGNPVSSDPDASAPNASDDAGAPETVIDILGNDDFLPNSDPASLGTTSIAPVVTGTTCIGTAVFDALSGSVTYTAAASETTGSCDLVYEVCSTSSGSITVCEIATVNITLVDTDGDGVPDSLDSDPIDECVPSFAGTPASKDCDKDGNPFSGDPDPAAPNATDDTGIPNVAIDILANDDFLPNIDPGNLGTTTITPIATGTTCAGGAVYDALAGTVVYTAVSSETSGTCDLAYEVCSTDSGGNSVCENAIVSIAFADADGDGTPDSLDSNPANACVPDMGGIPGSKDCDGDGNPAATDPDPGQPSATNDNGVAGTPIDILANDNFLPNNDPSVVGTTTITHVGGTCTSTVALDANTGMATYIAVAGDLGPSCTLDYQVCSNSSAVNVCETATVTVGLSPTATVDTDGDGVPDAQDPDPADYCVPNMSGTPGTKDCDGDGNAASQDPDPSAPDASDDTGVPGSSIDILGNDDFLPNNNANVLGNTTITQVGGTCNGPVVFDANTGSAIYSAVAADIASNCTIDYRVCSTSNVGLMVCENATITIALQNGPLTPVDSDNDGVSDSLDSNPANPCVPNMGGIPFTKDCDGDGNPVSSDPEPSAPETSDDAGLPGVPVDILGNDDFLPNNDPANIGTTTLMQVGGNCSGAVVLDANTGFATYTAGTLDSGPSCSVSYEVCSVGDNCEIATITISLPVVPNAPNDSDGDGITDSLDAEPADPCSPNMGGMPTTKDCDGDGSPVSVDPNPATPVSNDDSGVPGVPINVLGNDNFLPNNDPANLGTTNIVAIGGSCSGIALFDAVTGYMTYSAGTSDVGASCTVEYRVCNTDSSGSLVCGYATVTISNIASPSTDSDGDGIPDSLEGTADSDTDGVPNYLDLDSDNDGLLDATELTEDTDRDGVPDYLDLDSDNDGLTDTLEAGGLDSNADGIVDNFSDINNDGWADSVASSPHPEPDFDNDGFVDYLDLDSDNDGLSDLMESLGASADTNDDGMLDNPQDNDNNGLVDGVNSNSLQNNDTDNSPDHLDVDSDNDGEFDLVEAGGSDADGNGEVDTWADFDNDGIPNSVDADFTGGVDDDQDGIDDSADVTFIFENDSDGDGIVDQFDADFQGDGFAPITSDVPPLLQGNGIVHIGLQGSGCMIGTSGAGADPTLPVLALLSLLWIGWRRRAGMGLLLVTTATLAVSGCGVFDRGQYDGSRSINNSATGRHELGFRRHLYAATGIGASWLEPDTSEVQGVEVDDRVNTGGQITLGADVTKHLSFELHSADLGSAGLSPSGRINYHMHGGSALIYAGKNRHRHVRRGFTGYGRVGFGVLDDSAVGNVDYVEDNGTHVLFGAGLEYATRMGLGLRAEVISFDADVKYGQLGLIYRMGGDHREKPRQIVEAPKQEPLIIPAPEPLSPVVPAIRIVEAPVDQCARFNGVLEGVNFHSDSANLTATAQSVLDGVAAELSNCAGTPIAISAHTDNQGAAAYNKGLSKRRAVSVAKYLFSRGVEVSRMKASAYGESRPIESNATPQGRERNRRVELVVSQ